MAISPEVRDVNIYELLQVAEDSQEKAIRKAYRKVALKFHPDKNPAEDAKKKFLLLSLALETLTDAELRKEYDNLRRAQRAEVERVKELNAEQQRLRKDLESREKAAAEAQYRATCQKHELDQLRKEGRKRRRDWDLREQHQPASEPVKKYVTLRWREKDIQGLTLTQSALHEAITRDCRACGVDDIAINACVTIKNAKKKKSIIAMICFETQESVDDFLRVRPQFSDPLLAAIRNVSVVDTSDSAVPVKAPATASKSTGSAGHQTSVLKKLREAQKLREMNMD